MKKQSIIILFIIAQIGYAQKVKQVVKGWTAYSQNIDVSNKEGMAFRVSAAIKATVENKGANAALWVRVDKKDRSSGFFKNNAYSTKVTDTWKRYTINGIIDKTASVMYFGAFCQNNGQFYFDDFKVEIQDENGNWNALAIPNHSFEKELTNTNWREGISKYRIDRAKHFTITQTNTEATEGKHALKITGKGIIGNSPNGKYVNANGVKLYYEIYGEGEPLLMLHGNGQSISAFLNQVEEFSKTYKVILLDSRGRGNSTYNEAVELTYTLQAEDTKLVLDALHLESVNILGWSDGGNIGLIMAINYPEKVKKLVAMGANINPEGNKDLDGMFSTIEKLEKEKSSKNDIGIDLYKLMAYYPKLEYRDLSVIKAKTLIMAGDHDVIKNIHTVKMYEAIPNGSLAILPNETHWVPQQNPKLFNQIVLDFFKN